MKTLAKDAFTFRRSFILPALVVGVGLILIGRVTAQTFTTLHSFTATNPQIRGTNSDGASPNGLLLSGETLYGMASIGGSSGVGTVFAVNTDGTGFTTLYSFTFGDDGGYPYAGLILSGNTLYGATYAGNVRAGAVFAVNTDGTGFTTLYSFSNGSEGGQPEASLILSGDTLYGTTVYGGSSFDGTVFAVNTDGTGFTTLYSFTGGNDGAGPDAGLILSGNTLYGTAVSGGSSRSGTVFKVNTDGTGFATLHSFTAVSGPPLYSNSDGGYPRGALILSGNTLYGTASGGGNSEAGTVFKVNTNGTGFTTLHRFTATSGTSGYSGTNSDGFGPFAGLILSGNTLYGTASRGGSSGWGTVFAVNTDGTGFTTLHSFTGFSGGASPQAGLILSDNTLYGTTQSGGSSFNGTVFSLSFAPQLTITRSGDNVILTWPTNYAGFDYTRFTLQSAPAITGTFTNIPGATSPYTNAITGSQQFFRLSQ